MPTRLDTNFPPPTNDDEFESLIRDICVYEWDDSNTQRFGRTGQKQFGVDVYGQPSDMGGVYRAAQCKLRKKDDQLSESEIEHEVKQAKDFPHKLDTLIIVASNSRDTHVQIIVDKINEREQATGGFNVVVWFWDTIIERLATYPRLIVRYYRDYYASLTNLPLVESLIDIPLGIVNLSLASQAKALPLTDFLRLRGLRILEPSTVSPALLTTVAGSEPPDGMLCDCSAVDENYTEHDLMRKVGRLLGHVGNLEIHCPVFVLIADEHYKRFIQAITTLGGNPDRFRHISTAGDVAASADEISNVVFAYGYPRRGAFPTVELSARSAPRPPHSALLDIDWQHWLTPGNLPTTEQWESLLEPALLQVSQQLIQLGSNTRIQINSVLQLPAAIALGFHFNLRVAKIGVWARQAGISDFKRQFWLSNNTPGDSNCHDNWIQNPDVGGSTTIIELATVDIHSSVRSYAQANGLTVDLWLQMLIKQTGTNLNIEEAQAIAIAQHLAATVRQLNARGVTDIHLFVRGPSALGVLLGQRLVACGRIHLYWFENPSSYRYAFTLQ